LNYPGGLTGAHCNTDWQKTCDSDEHCQTPASKSCEYCYAVFGGSEPCQLALNCDGEYCANECMDKELKQYCSPFPDKFEVTSGCYPRPPPPPPEPSQPPLTPPPLPPPPPPALPPPSHGCLGGTCIAKDFGDSATCDQGFAVTEYCGSGEDKNCRGETQQDMSVTYKYPTAVGQIWCNMRVALSKETSRVDRVNKGSIAICPANSVITSICFSGKNRDCPSKDKGGDNVRGYIICTKLGPLSIVDSRMDYLCPKDPSQGKDFESKTAPSGSALVAYCNGDKDQDCHGCPSTSSAIDYEQHNVGMTATICSSSPAPLEDNTVMCTCNSKATDLCTSQCDGGNGYTCDDGTGGACGPAEACAAGVDVTFAKNSITSICVEPCEALCTFDDLRDAITDERAQINLVANRIYKVTSTLDIGHSVTIQSSPPIGGPWLDVDGRVCPLRPVLRNAQDVKNDATDGTAVLQIDAGNVQIIGLSITGGYYGIDRPNDDPDNLPGLLIKGANVALERCLIYHIVSFTVSIFGTMNGIGYGGGLQIEGPASVTLDSCEIYENRAHEGAGLYARDITRLIVTNSSIFSNDVLTGLSSDGVSEYSKGGGVYLEGSWGQCTFTNSIISDNLANWGGGVYLYGQGTATFDGCEVNDNHASSEGDNIWINDEAVVCWFGASEPSGVYPKSAGIQKDCPVA